MFVQFLLYLYLLSSAHFTNDQDGRAVADLVILRPYNGRDDRPLARDPPHVPRMSPCGSAVRWGHCSINPQRVFGVATTARAGDIRRDEAMTPPSPPPSSSEHRNAPSASHVKGKAPRVRSNSLFAYRILTNADQRKIFCPPTPWVSSVRQPPSPPWYTPGAFARG